MPILDYLKFCSAGGLGGCMPTLCGMAATFASQNEVGNLNALMLGLAIYFLIGAITALIFAEKNMKAMFIAGIAAPAVIASINIGTSIHSPQNSDPATKQGPLVISNQ